MAESDKEAFLKDAAQTAADRGRCFLRNTRIPTDYFMNRCFRNPFTGKTHLEDLDLHYDFSIVDLKSRQTITGTPKELAEDPYLYRAVPLNLRTWLYQNRAMSQQTGWIKWITQLKRRFNADAGIFDGLHRRDFLFSAFTVFFLCFYSPIC